MSNDPTITPRRQWAIVVVGVLLASSMFAGCAVGPDFDSPPPPDAKAYTPEPLPGRTASAGDGGAQAFVMDKDVPARWWTYYRSDALDALIDGALKASPSLDAAKAALRQAQENVYAAQGGFFPSLSGSASATREKSSGASFGIPGLSSLFSVASTSVSVSYTPDIFGGTRRQVESDQAAADYEHFELAAAYLTLTSNVVTSAVQEASLRAQIAATEQIIDIESHELDVLQQQLALGGVAGTAVLAQQATLAQSRAALPPLQKQLAQSRYQLAVLAGRFPSEDVGATFALSQMTLPRDLPVSLPSKLVAQRPDIRAAEAQLHEASANIGIATANELPQISLTGSYGSTASSPGNLLSAGTGVWSIGGSVAQTIFDGGELLHKRRAAVAAYDEAAAQYRSTVLSAFQDVANALRALQSDADALNADIAAENASAQSLSLSRQQFQLGAITYTALLNAEQSYQQALLTRVQAEAARYSDTAVLFQALGGGWWNEDADLVDPAKPDRWAISLGH
jgi:NodT family efflux transporter outer membrane factor (OMF) lipoprotein